MLKIDSPAFTRHHENYMKNISFLWPPVVTVQAMQAVDVIIPWKTILIPRIQLCPSDPNIAYCVVYFIIRQSTTWWWLIWRPKHVVV